ncbi:serine/threonine-protein kinase [Bacillus vallismortis]|uniref:Serine/threonine protein kinase n=1 Tax=Bacillus vallismortis TaxID=72361 RepID=A0AAP3CLK6_BACVA|nr:serine/threonine-protein kinase [Bacillus vallismortis]MCY7919162.1 serine/threonine protein kinase [Bacillus vallismortis]MCY8318528.1 serine/threonine protein kinase [Bacillus vallismortis]
MFKINQIKVNLNLDIWNRIGFDQGMNSEVYTARDPQLNQVLILKKITKKSLIKQDIEDFFLESKILNESRHPLIMPIFYAGEDKDHILITMPYYENGSLESLMDKRFLTTREIIKFALDFLTGLLFMHTKNILHLDIKPTNIILNDNNRALLTDFGLSRFTNDDGLIKQKMQYSSHRSPESYESLERTILDDIYQAGITLYRMCNGNVNFKEQFKKLNLTSSDMNDLIKRRKKGEFPKKEYLPHIPLKLERIINKAIHPNPNNRHQSVLNMINELCKVDGTLDWFYSYNKRDGTHQWKCNNQTSIITLLIKYNNGVFLTSGTKYAKNSKKTSNLTPPKGQFDNLRAAFKYVQRMLENYS